MTADSQKERRGDPLSCCVKSMAKKMTMKMTTCRGQTVSPSHCCIWHPVDWVMYAAYMPSKKKEDSADDVCQPARIVPHFFGKRWSLFFQSMQMLRELSGTKTRPSVGAFGAKTSVGTKTRPSANFSL